MYKRIFIFLLIASFAKMQAQPYKNGNKTRQRFAQSSLGLDFYHAWGGTALLPLNDSEKVNTALNNGINPRIHLGGLHFWGHAEFYFNINLSAIRFDNNGPLKIKHNQGDAFGIKYFPKAVTFGRLNFYMGTGVSAANFRATNSGVKTATYNTVNLPATIGLFYFKNRWGFDLSFTYLFNSTLSYYYTKEHSVNMQQPSLLINFGIRKLFETTVSTEKDYLSGRTDSVYRELKKAKKLSSFYFGAGPSSAFYLKENQNNSNTFAFMGNNLAIIFPEACLGYYYHPFKMHTNLVFRYGVLNKSAFDVSQKFTRMATGIETHITLFDYNGFVPFLGINLSYESLTYNENNNGAKSSYAFQGFKPGIVFGWDILPDRLQYFTLRTNLRYFPNLDINLKDGKKVSLDQLEFNFIEFIYYPSRKKNILKALN